HEREREQREDADEAAADRTTSETIAESPRDHVAEHAEDAGGEHEHRILTGLPAAVDEQELRGELVDASLRCGARDGEDRDSRRTPGETAREAAERIEPAGRDGVGLERAEALGLADARAEAPDPEDRREPDQIERAPAERHHLDRGEEERRETVSERCE